MRIAKLVVAMASLLATAASAQDASGDEMISLERSSDWMLDYAEHRCRMAVAFGEGDNRTILVFEQYSPSDQIRWLIAGPYLKRLRRGRELTVQFGPVFEPFTVKSDGRSFGEFGSAVQGEWQPSDYGAIDESDDATTASLSSTRIDVTEGTDLGWIAIQRRGKPMLRLETGELETIYGAMNSCLDSLVESWGLDAEQDRNRATEPVFSNRDAVFRTLRNSYPNSALSRGLQADLHLRLMVDENGDATECVITNVTIAESFNDSACDALMKRGEFEPARDNQGRAIPSYYSLFIYYRMS